MSQLSQLGIHPKIIHYDLPVPRLLEFALKRNEGILSINGALCVKTGVFTGRSPEDRYVVSDNITSDHVSWGKINRPMDEYIFNTIFDKVKRFVNESEMFAFNGMVGADEKMAIPVHVLTDRAWQCLFANNMFIKKRSRQPTLPEFTVIVVNNFSHFSELEKNKEAFIIINIKQRLILIGGTSYAGEIKKAMFSVMNYLLPEKDVLPMHCSANVRKNNNVALFFGLSGTGKTTLSADSKRNLVGDDEHGWSEDGIFNFEGGCYAKCIDLREEKEPQIWNAIRFGSILENVVIDPNSRIPDFADASITENTRASYPLEYIDGALLPSKTGHPEVIVFLTADAFGVLPPVAKLTIEGAMYHFMSGYTSKLAGTEKGVKEPTATFSECFGAPFMPRDVRVYANILGENIINLETRLFYTHKGIEKLAEQMPIDDVVLLSERIAGDESVANSTALCQAIEKIARVKIPKKAEQTRTICAEMERIYNHLGTLAGLSTDAGFAFGAARLNILKEKAMQLNEKISGSRILFGVNRIGGVKIELTEINKNLILKDLAFLGMEFRKIIEFLRKKSSFIDRLKNTGRITKEDAVSFGIVGVAARSIGIDVDARRDHPYANYSSLHLDRHHDTPYQKMQYEVELQKRNGDVLSRFMIRVEEIQNSIMLIEQTLHSLEDASLYCDVGPLEPYHHALGYAESHRGQTLHWVMNGKDNSIYRYKVRTASFCNWKIIEQAVLNDIVADFPLINKSLDLSYSGNDL